MLFLAVHTIEVPSSRVPLSCIVLSDVLKRKGFPPGLKLRMVIPSSGHSSCTLWDADSEAEVKNWCEENLQDCRTDVAEVPEEFAYGISLELTTSRAADKVRKVATSSKATIERINTASRGAYSVASASITDKLDRLDQRTHIISATREATSAAVSKVRAATDRAMETETMQSTVAAVQTSMASLSTSMGRAFSWVNTKVKEAAGVPAGTTSASFSAYDDRHDYPDSMAAPPLYEAAASAPAAANPAYMPVSTHPTRGSTDAKEDVPPPPQFTLQDDGNESPGKTAQAHAQ